jgi:hypothetical protein
MTLHDGFVAISSQNQSFAARPASATKAPGSRMTSSNGRKPRLEVVLLFILMFRGRSSPVKAALALGATAATEGCEVLVDGTTCQPLPVDVSMPWIVDTADSWRRICSVSTRSSAV